MSSPRGQAHDDRENLASLLQQARLHRPGAAEELRRLYERGLRRVARRRLHPGVRSVEDVDDVVQNVWLKFFSEVLGKEEFDSFSKLESYLLKMASNQAKDANRKYLDYGKHNLRKQCPLDREDGEGGSDLVDAVPGPVQSAVFREFTELHQKFIALLGNPDNRAWMAAVETLPWPDELPAKPKAVKRLMDAWPADQVAILQAVAEEGSIEGAARKLAMSPSVVRGALNRLHHFLEAEVSVLAIQLRVDLFFVVGAHVQRDDLNLLPDYPVLTFRFAYVPRSEANAVRPDCGQASPCDRSLPCWVTSEHQIPAVIESFTNNGALRYVGARSAVWGIGPNAWDFADPTGLFCRRAPNLQNYRVPRQGTAEYGPQATCNWQCC